MSSSLSGNKPHLCSICGKEVTEAYRPFCSKRCADVDLARWFSGSYAIGGREEDEGDGAVAEDRRKSSQSDDEEG